MLSFLLFPLSCTLAFGSFVIPLVRAIFARDRPEQRAKGSLQRAATARTADENWTVHDLAMI